MQSFIILSMLSAVGVVFVEDIQTSKRQQASHTCHKLISVSRKREMKVSNRPLGCTTCGLGCFGCISGISRRTQVKGEELTLVSSGSEVQKGPKSWKIPLHDNSTSVCHAHLVLPSVAGNFRGGSFVHEPHGHVLRVQSGGRVPRSMDRAEWGFKAG